MKNTRLHLAPAVKRLRSRLVRAYMERAGLTRAVCFTCGNAGRALLAEGVSTLVVGEGGILVPGRWWNPAEIARTWPGWFDATCGHLPLPLMVDLARHLRREVGHLQPGGYEVPTGSGETIVCLRWAYPLHYFEPVQDGTPATAWHEDAPLYPLFTLNTAHARRLWLEA